jgi:hypothetical protein
MGRRPALKMIDKGWAMMTDMENLGYVSQVKERMNKELAEKRNSYIQILILVACVLAVILAAYSIIKDIWYQSKL